jgi:hypothetical protein
LKELSPHDHDHHDWIKSSNDHDYQFPNDPIEVQAIKDQPNAHLEEKVRRQKMEHGDLIALYGYLLKRLMRKLNII